ncbi:Catalase, partial [Fragariocoptes setiger]
MSPGRKTLKSVSATIFNQLHNSSSSKRTADPNQSVSSQSPNNNQAPSSQQQKQKSYSSDKQSTRVSSTTDNNQARNFTMTSGAPVGDKTNSLTVGPRGPTLLQDVAFIDEIAHFDRERIPERVVHAKGGGAFGFFEVTETSFTKYCKATLFAKKGLKTPIAMRFSTVGGESGSADTVRDPRGFAIKFYTDEGNFDLVGNNTPIFFIRDPMQFPSFVHSQKRNPQTHLKDPDAFWDFISLRPEAVHQVLFLFSDRGIPDGFRHMHGFGSHTFKVVNANNEAYYVKFHMRTNQGIKNMDPHRATELAGQDPDYSIRDLQTAIIQRNYPSWTLEYQVMTFEQADKLPFNPFDVTKTWSHKDFPRHMIGQLVLERNPTNYFAEIEQLAFCPANMVPGIEPSPDKMLQGRLFSYSDTQRYRLGANFNDIPVNRPRCPVMNPTFRDGPYCFTENYGNLPNYYPNSQLTKINIDPNAMEHRQTYQGEVYRHDTADDDNFSQAAEFYNRVLKKDEKARLIHNLVDHLQHAKPFIQERMINNFNKVSPELGQSIAAGVAKHAKK